MRRFLHLLAVFIMIAGSVYAQSPSSAASLKPYRALLVVDSWNDERSEVVTAADKFQPVAALLKAWSVPFDILRLDQQNPGSGFFFERSGRVRYGVVIWLADLASYAGKKMESLDDAVKHGSSLLVACSRFADPVLGHILGLKYKADFRAADPLLVGPSHFITRALGKDSQSSEEFGSHMWVQPAGAQVLVSQGRHPALTVHEPESDTAAVWMGAPSIKSLVNSPYWRLLFQRSLTWALGYLIVPDFDYSKEILVMIDDWGAADKTFLSYWRYQSVPEELMREKVIPVFKQHHVTASANVVTGFVDRKSHRILSPWEQKFTDGYGVLQDFGSTRRGLLAAVEAGVIEIESHGWTHMQADLDSPPGPWWNADLEGEGSVGGWYEEFEDTRRGVEASAADQRFHLQRSLQYLKEDFNVQPLSIIIGGGGWSKSYTNQSARIAADAGFGLFDINSSYFYLDHGLTLDMTGISPGATHQYDRELRPSEWPKHPDGPYVLLFHDRDISLQHEFVKRTFDAVPKDAKFISMNQYIGVLHTQVQSANDGLELQFDYDEHYCAYFRNHASSWKLLMADPLAARMKPLQKRNVVVDTEPSTKISDLDLTQQQFSIQLPAGIGSHRVKIVLE